MFRKKLLLGAHMSIAGGLSEALIRGASINCTAIQIFTKSNRQWIAKEPTKEEIALFAKIKKETGITDIIAHASYLINMGSPNPEIHKKSVIAATKEFKVCQDLEIPFLVIHPGAYTTSTPEKAIVSIAQGIEKILNHVPGPSMILLETMAGQGTTIGSTFKELAAIRELISDKSRVGICLDTCHVFAAGYDITTPEGYSSLWKEFDKAIGISHLKAIHLNDSKKECCSYIDRHEDIGQGKIGIEGFRLLMNDTRFFSIPKILETPKADLQDDARNMATLKKLLSEENRKIYTIEKT
jgi:deoxyribonuclease-4